MRTFQTKFISAIETTVQEISSDLELVQAANFSNTGVLYVQRGDQFYTLLTIAYDFQGSGKHKIQLNGAELGDHRNAFYFAATDSIKIAACLAQIEKLLIAALRRAAA